MYNTLGLRLQYLVNTYGNKKVANLASVLGVPPNTLGNYVSGERSPKHEFLLLILEKFPEISIKWLVLGKGDPKDSDTNVREMVDFFTQNGIQQLLDEKQSMIDEKDARIKNLEKQIEQMQKTLDYFLTREEKQGA